jgi:hypothetical protein
MPVDENPHRIFIGDLDAAIAEIEAEERAAAEKQQERAFFLPDDVDKEISGVPEQVLKSSYGAADPGPSQARARIRERSNRLSSSTSPAIPSDGDLVSCDEDFGYPLGRHSPGWQSEQTNDHSSHWETDAMDLEWSNSALEAVQARLIMNSRHYEDRSQLRKGITDGANSPYANSKTISS